MNTNRIHKEYLNIKICGLPKDFNGFKIVHLSDIHLPARDEIISEILSITKHERPDMIAVTGDTVTNYQDMSKCGAPQLMRQLACIAQLFVVTGNHEHRTGSLPKYKRLIAENGGIPLFDAHHMTQKGSGRIAVMGALDQCSYTPTSCGAENLRVKKLLLNHRPHSPKIYGYLESEIRPNIVLSGHAHGGQIRLPLIGGLLAPNQGIFPRYTSGLYQESDVSLVVSRGLGNSSFPFRLFNRFHIPIITLEC